MSGEISYVTCRHVPDTPIGAALGVLFDASLPFGCAPVAERRGISERTINMRAKTLRVALGGVTGVVLGMIVIAAERASAQVL